MHLTEQAWHILNLVGESDGPVQMHYTAEDVELRDGLQALLTDRMVEVDTVVQTSGGVGQMVKITDRGRDALAVGRYVWNGLSAPVRTGAEQGGFDLSLSSSSFDDLTLLGEALEERTSLDALPKTGLTDRVRFEVRDPERDADDDWKLEQVRKWLQSPKWSR